jgi:hypothetical protein
LLGELGFRGEIVGEAVAVIDRAEKQLRALLGHDPGEPPEPTHVVVFSGHMIDNPAERGEGKVKPPRFPPSKTQPAAARVRAALDEIGAGAKGSRREMTILFCDMKGFTTFSEGMTPAALVTVLNRYMTVMSEPVRRHSGIIDKYIGDAVIGSADRWQFHPSADG